MFQEKEPVFTPIEHYGEFELIELLTQNFNKQKRSHVVKAVGDDAAVFDAGGPELQLITTDLLAEGVHFDLAYAPLAHLGYKAAIVNFSDIYAMNGRPKSITVGLAVGRRYSVEALEELYKGLRYACEEHNVSLLGGDMTSSRSGLVVAITALGTAPKDRVVYRSGAKEFDLLCLSGDAGGAFAGLQILQREKSVFEQNPEVQPDLSGYEYVVERQLRPQARQDVVEFLEQEKILPTAMIDVSDGIASEVHHICRASDCGAAVYQAKLPVDYQTQQTAEAFGLEGTTYALYGGEDYELLFTVDQKYYDQVATNPALTIIGHIMDKSQGVRLAQADNSVVDLKPKGFNHFAKEEERQGED